MKCKKCGEEMSTGEASRVYYNGLCTKCYNSEENKQEDCGVEK